MSAAVFFVIDTKTNSFSFLLLQRYSHATINSLAALNFVLPFISVSYVLKRGVIKSEFKQI